ncbi:hypothetical protein CR513_23145, partial [Mucuna pruriens]
MEDEPSGEGSALILGRPFFMTAKTKIDVHVGTLSMEFGDTYVKFNIFEELKHPTKDHSIFSIDAIEGLMEEYFQLGTSDASLADFVNIYDVIKCFYTVATKVNSEILSNTLYFSCLEDSISNLIHCRIDEVLGNSQHAKFPVASTNESRVKGATNLIKPSLIMGSSSKRLIAAEIDSNMQEPTKTDSNNQGAETVPHSQQEAGSDSSRKESHQTKAESNSEHPSLLSDRVSQPTPSTQEKYVSPQPQTIELKSLPKHLKYTYLGDNQQFSVIIANNLNREQEEKLLEVLGRHKKEISWNFIDLPRINPSICMHKFLLEEDA